MTVRTASGPRFTRPGEVTELHEELERIQDSPGLIEQAAQTVRRAAPAARPIGRGARLGWARVRARLGTLGGLACGATAGWQLGTVPGLLSTMVALFLAEFNLRGTR